MENGRERERGHFHLIFFSRNNTSFWDESDSEKGVGRFEMQLKILTHVNLINTSIPGSSR